MYELKTNTAARIAVGPLVDPTDGKTAETALTVTDLSVQLYQIKTDGTAVVRSQFAPTASGGNNDMALVTSSTDGMYDLELTASQLNFLGNGRITFYDVDGFLVHWIDLLVVSAAYFDWKYGSTIPDVNTTKIGGTTQTGRDIGASVLLSSGTGTGQLDFTAGVVKANLAQILGTTLTETAGYLAAAFKQFFNIASPTSTMNTITSVTTTTNLTNLPAVSTDWLTAAGVKADAVTKIQSGLATPTNITAGTITTVTNLTNAPTAGDLTATMKSSVTTAATAATPALSAAGVSAIWAALTSGLTTAGSIGKKLADWVVGTIDTYTGNTKQTGDAYVRLGAPVGASVSADVAAVKAETASILADTNELQSDWANGGRLDNLLDGASAPTAAAVADAVWDEAISGHLTSGTTGNALNSAGSAGDPWSTPLPGAYGSGTAGKIIGDNINAAISSRSSHSAADVWSVATRTLTSFGTLVSDIWGAATRTLTAISDSSGITTLLTRISAALSFTGGNVHAHIKAKDNLDFGALEKASLNAATPAVTVSDKTGFSLATTPPTAAQIRAEMDDNSTKLASVDAATTSAKAVTDKLDTALELDGAVYRLTANALEQAPAGEGGSTLTVSDIVNGVLDEALSGHDTAGTVGAALSASGAAADPLASAVPGSYATGTAGFVLGSYLPSPGTGTVSYNYTLTESGGTAPIRGVDVRVSTDAAGENIIAYAVTNYDGIASFLLDPGTYYFWRTKNGYTFTDPDVEVVS